MSQKVTVASKRPLHWEWELSRDRPHRPTRQRIAGGVRMTKRGALAAGNAAARRQKRLESTMIERTV